MSGGTADRRRNDGEHCKHRAIRIVDAAENPSVITFDHRLQNPVRIVPSLVGPAILAARHA